jgi:hypothetical protein
MAAVAVLVWAAATNGAVPLADEGTPAHLWQLLMALQVPIVAVFALRWLPLAPREASVVIALQMVAVLASALPVFLLGL